MIRLDRSLLRTLFRWTAAALVAAPLAALAAYPEKPIRIIVPYPAGGATDQMARAIQAGLTEILKQPVIIDNRGGAGGAIGTQAAVIAPPDGYTLVFGNSGPNSILPLVRKLAFDPINDLKPISLVALVPMILAVPAESPAKTAAEFIALSRRDGAKLNYGSVGNGSISHLTGEYFKTLTGSQIVHIPYNGGAPLMTAFGTGDVQAAFVTGIDAAAMHRAGKLRYLAVASEKATPVVPGLPTLSEQLPGFNAVAWFGLLAPAGVPDDIIAALNAAVVQAVARKDVRDYFTERNIEARSSTPADFGKLIRDDNVQWGEVVRKQNIKE